MNRTDFRIWLAQWVARHPVRTPGQAPDASYAEDVMRRVKAASVPQERPAAAWWLRPWPAIAVACASVAVVASLVAERQPVRVAERADQDLRVLDALGVAPDAPEDVTEEELRGLDQLVLAEAQRDADEEAWIEQTLQVLDGLEEEPEALHELQEELELLDELEMTAGA